MSVKIGILDYGIGNVRSLGNAFTEIGASPVVGRAHGELMACDALIVPGVGAFSEGMKNLRSYSLDATVREFQATGRPLIGICLGMHLLFDEGEEFSPTAGLGLIPGRVSRIRTEAKLPHMAWAKLQPSAAAPPGLLGKDEMYYFCHSYVATPTDLSHVLAEAVYGGHRFACVVGRGNVTGIQFHPEKSAAAGLALLKALSRRSPS